MYKDSISRARVWLRFHLLAIIGSLVVFVLAGSFPFFLHQLSVEEGVAYTPVAIRGGFDEVYYVIRGSSVVHQNIVGETSTYEHFGTPLSLPPLNPTIISAISNIVGSLDISVLVIGSVFPVFIFLLVYLIAFELTKSRLWAITFALLFLVFPRFGLWPSPGSIPLLSDPRQLYFSRVDYPAITFPFFALAIYAFVRLCGRREVRGGLLLGVTLGLLFYTYLYDWVYVCVVIGIATVIAIIKKDWWLVRQYGSALGTALLISVPYWITMVTILSLPTFADIQLRLGVEFGRYVRWDIVYLSYGRALVFCALVWMLYRKINARLVYILVPLILPIIILLNLQLITGVVPQPDHWQRVTFLGMSLAVFCMVVGMSRLIGYERPVRRGVLCLTLGALVWMFSVQYQSARESFPTHVVSVPYQAAYQWLAFQRGSLSVIGALSGETNDALALAYGGPLFTPNGFHTSASTDELWQRAIILAKLLRLPPESFAQYIQEESIYLFTDQYRDHTFNAYFKTGQKIVPDTVLAKKVEYYRSIKAYNTVPYRLDYIIIGPREERLGARPPSASFARLVYNVDGVRIYALLQ